MRRLAMFWLFFIGRLVFADQPGAVVGFYGISTWGIDDLSVPRIPVAYAVILEPRELAGVSIGIRVPVGSDGMAVAKSLHANIKYAVTVSPENVGSDMFWSMRVWADGVRQMRPGEKLAHQRLTSFRSSLVGRAAKSTGVLGGTVLKEAISVHTPLGDRKIEREFIEFVGNSSTGTSPAGIYVDTEFGVLDKEEIAWLLSHKGRRIFLYNEPLDTTLNSEKRINVSNVEYLEEVGSSEDAKRFGPGR